MWMGLQGAYPRMCICAGRVGSVILMMNCLKLVKSAMNNVSTKESIKQMYIAHGLRIKRKIK